MIIGHLERHFTHSRFQSSIFSKTYFYYIMNMLIIPGISLSSVRSLFQIVFDKNYDIPSLLGEIYLTDSGISCLSFYFIHLQLFLFQYSKFICLISRF